MAETKKASGEDQTGNPVDQTDLEKQFDELNKRNKDLADQLEAQKEMNKELQEELEGQKAITDDMPVVTVGKDKYRLRKGDLRTKYQGQNRRFTHEEVKKDKDLQKHLVDIKSGYLTPIKSKS